VHGFEAQRIVCLRGLTLERVLREVKVMGLLPRWLWPFILHQIPVVNAEQVFPRRQIEMKHIIAAIFPLATLATIAYSQTGQASFRPKEGFVPNAETAVKVGEAVLMPVYGEKTIVRERPFKAALQGEVWRVAGTLHCDGPPGETCPGGTAVVKISKTSGQILFMMHYQ
jgi:NTF2 fold immunity protein